MRARSPGAPPAPVTAALSPRATGRALLGYARGQVPPIGCGGLLGLAGTAALPAQPFAAEELVEGLGDRRPVTGALTALSLLVVLGTGLRAAGQYVLAHAAESVVRDARRRITGRVPRLRFAELDRVEPGDLLARVSSDTTLLRQIIARSLVTGATAVVTPAGAAVLTALLDPALPGVTAGVTALTCLVPAVTMPRIARATARSRAAVGAMGAVFERALGALRTVRASGAEERETARRWRAVGPGRS
ncbi:ABC transporter transmembrane domain-containing protein [Streptomyces sp. CRN 30]|uniref:ABC transporter transmembrane domain-containing protein n=1 Tax=Streptomyces sp. CRN 30 TaxID=3075613 RepID=UPI002A7FF328|nr:ABC transporter transmembrane domain-containing protein [Streptomyces sp. CRN 30]